MESVTMADDTTPVRQITYSGLGNPISVTSHPGDNGAGTTYPDITVSYAWDASGRMTAETDGAGNTWTYAYNSRGLLAESRDPLYDAATHPYATRIAYDLEGRVEETTVSDGAATDPDIVSSVSMTYLPSGEVETRSFTGGEGSETYTYDAHGRLEGAASPAGSSLTYENYDAANRPRTLGYELAETTYTETCVGYLQRKGSPFCPLDLCPQR